MSFTPKDWRDGPDETTPLSAAAHKDLEQRLANYIDASIAAIALGGGGGGTSAIELSPSNDMTGSTDDTNYLDALASAIATGKAIRVNQGAHPYYTATGWTIPGNTPDGTITGTITANSNQFTGLVAGTMAVPAVGSMVYVYGPGIPAGSILTITGATTGTLSVPIVGPGGNTEITVCGRGPTGSGICVYGEGKPRLCPLGQATGIWTHRTSSYGTAPVDNPPASEVRGIIIDGTMATSVTKSNEALNPNFEYDTVGAAPSGWSSQISVTSTLVSWLTDDSWAAGGSFQSGRLIATMNAAGAGYTKLSASGTGATPVVGSRTYQVQTQVRVNALAPGNKAAVGVRWYDAAGATISTPTMPTTCYTNTTGVILLSGVITAPSNAAFMGIRIGFATDASAAGTSDANFDNVMVSEADSVQPYRDGDSLGWHWTGAPGNSVSSFVMGGVGLDCGDGDSFDVDVTVCNFTSAGSIGAYLVNRVFSTNRSKFKIRSYRNTTLVKFAVDNDIDQSNTSVNFFDNEIEIVVRAKTDQNGIVVDGASLKGGSLKISGSLPPTSAVRGSTAPTGDAALLYLVNGGTLYRVGISSPVRADTTGGASTNILPWTIFSDGGSIIQQCEGAIVTGLNGAQMNGAECSFSGPYSYGDNLVWPSTAFPGYGIKWFNRGPDANVTILPAGGSTITDIWVNRWQSIVTQGTFFIGAGGNLTVNGSGTIPSYKVLPARMITEGIPDPAGAITPAVMFGNSANFGNNAFAGCSGGSLDLCSARALDQLLFGNTTTKMAQQLMKIYLMPGNDNYCLPTDPFTHWSNLSAFIAAGGKVLVSLRPSTNFDVNHNITGSAAVFNTATDNAFAACIDGLVTRLGTNWKGVLWQECNQAAFTGSSSTAFPAGASDYHSYVAHYAPIFRAHAPNIPLVYNPMIASGSTVAGASGAVAYKPNDQHFNEVAVDFYCSAYHYVGQALGAVEALADNNSYFGPVPFSLAEWGLRASPFVATHDEWNNGYIPYIRNLFQARRNNGKAIGWTIYYSGKNGAPTPAVDGSDNGWSTTSDFKIPGILSMYNALAV